MFKRMFRKSALKKALASYPVYAAPFTGDPKTFTREMAEANLKYLLDNREQRISHITRLLTDFGVGVSGADSDGDHRVFLDQLHEWVKKEWPGIFDRKLEGYKVWYASSRSGKEIVFSMLMDLGILLGQIVLDRRPEYSWQLDLDEETREDEEYTVNRPVVLHRDRPALGGPIIFDPEMMMVSLYFSAGSPLFGMLNDTSRHVQETLDGARESFLHDQEAVFASTIKPGRVVRYDDSGMQGMVLSKEPVPTQDWIDDQVNAAELKELGPTKWWGVLLFSGGYLLAPAPLLIVLREATYEDFLRAVHSANVAARKSLGELFPDYVKQVLTEQRLKDIFGTPWEDRSGQRNEPLQDGVRKPSQTYEVTGGRIDSKNREATKREVTITDVSGDRQIAVVMTEKDERQFMAFLRSTAPISILLPGAPSKDQIVIEDLPSPREAQRLFYLWNGNFGPCAPELAVNVKGNIYVKSPHRGPILEYWRASPRDWGPYTLGRLYWDPVIDPDGAYRVKRAYAYSYDVAAFEEWYELVESWVKENSRIKQFGFNEVHYLPSAWLWHGWYAPGRKLR